MTLTAQTQNKNETTELLTVHEVAQILRVDDSTVKRWIRSGALAAVKLPSYGQRAHHRVRVATLEALLRTRKQ
jgi:excisionase family DNA binding protein